MAKTLLLIGGVINALFTIFHILFWKLFDWPATIMYMSSEHRALVQVFNIHTAIAIGFFTVASLGFRNDLLTTRVGRLIIATIAVYFYVRALNSLIFWSISDPVNMFIFIVCLIVGGIYTYPLFVRRRV
jgi:hypothetical protein